MAESTDVQERILDSVFARLRSDKSVPEEVVKRLEQAKASGQLGDVDVILQAIQEGVREHAKN